MYSWKRFQKLPFIVFLNLILLSACGEQRRLDQVPADVPIQFVHGKIDASFLNKVQALNAQATTVAFGSFGGENKIGLKIAHEIEQRRWNVEIVGACLSACAEYLLPSATELHFINKPLVGYHHSPLILEHLLKENATKDLEFCERIGAKELRELLVRNGKNTDAWKITLEKLNLTYYRVDYKKDACPWSAKEFSNKFWFPTSTQLRTIFGLRFSGDVCADDPKCYEPQLKAAFGEGSGPFVVGDEIIIIDKEIEN